MPHKDPQRRRESARIRSARWYANDPARGRAKQKRWAEQNIEKSRAQGRASEQRRVERRFGIDYEALRSSQGGGCAICGRPDGGRVRNGRPVRLHIDHDHSTGEVRGLLCHPCNTAIGLCEDNPDRLRKAIHYLTTPRGITVSAPLFVQDRKAEGW